MHIHIARLFTILGLVLAGLLLTAGAGALIMAIAELTNPGVLEDFSRGEQVFTAGQTRLLLIIQHTLGFILPAYVFARIYYRPARIELIAKPERPKHSVLKAFDLQITPGMGLAGLGILFLIASYPLVNLSFMVNETMALPSWASNLEEQARETLEMIIHMPTPWVFLINLFIIAVLPGIGEELIFRGIVQKEIGGLLRSPIAAIWISAFIFSAIHFQLEGLFPRMVLGVVLGYLYYWTKNLWVPIIAHAANNGAQVILIYATGMDVSEMDEHTNQLQVWMIPLSVIAMYFIAQSIYKRKQLVKTS